MPDRSYFLYKLVPPRPSFAMDMTDAERGVMGEHATYWGGLLAARTAVVFGPVLDPAGVWGLAVVEAGSVEEVRAIGEGDPAVTSRVATFEAYPMMGAAARG